MGKPGGLRGVLLLALAALVGFVSARAGWSQCGCTPDGISACDCFCGFKQTFWSRRPHPYCEKDRMVCQYESCQTSGSTTTCAECNNLSCVSYDTYTCLFYAGGLSFCPCAAF